MTKQDKIAWINHICEMTDEYTRITGEVARVIGIDYEAALPKLAEQAISMALDICAEAIGDTAEWLSWYIYENDCGRRAGPVSWTTPDGGKVEMKVRSADDLLRVIEGVAE